MVTTRKRLIGAVLEKQRKESFKVLAVENSLFDKARASGGDTMQSRVSGRYLSIANYTRGWRDVASGEA